MALNRLDLDLLAAKGCEAPGCDHQNHDHTVYLHARCHLRAGLWAVYAHGEGVLRLTCKKCGKTVAEVAVAGAAEGGS